METIRQPRNSSLWLGVLLAICAVATLVLFFMQFPGQNLLPWINLLLSVLALLFVVTGLQRARSEPERYRGKTAGWIFTVFSALLLAFNLFAFFASRHLPAPNGAPAAGQKAPDFQLKDTQGQTMSLAQLLSQAGNSSGAAPKAVLLIFYRGYWWPFCNLELRGIEKQIAEFQREGVRPVAISVDSPDVSRTLATKAGYTFTILSDPNGEVIRRYNLLHPGGGPEGHEIARPAEFLVDHNGIVRWTNFAEDVRVRARAQEMLAQARLIN